LVLHIYTATTTNFTLEFNCTVNHYVEDRDSIGQFIYIFFYFDIYRKNKGAVFVYTYNLMEKDRLREREILE
jgi:hypothetical protein